jgi:Ser/Thr protein kinase RdoA (MazF antagonist)
MTAYDTHYVPLLQEELESAIPAYRDIRPLDRRTDEELEILLNHTRAVQLICSPRNKPNEARSGWEQGCDLLPTGGNKRLTLIHWFGSSRSRCYNDVYDYLRNNNVEKRIVFCPVELGGKIYTKTGISIGAESPHFTKNEEYTSKCYSFTLIKKYKNGKYWGEPLYDMENIELEEIMREILKEVAEDKETDDVDEIGREIHSIALGK